MKRAVKKFVAIIKILTGVAVFCGTANAQLELQYQHVTPSPFDSLKDTRVDFGDVDGDNDKDVLIIGQLESGAWTTRLYKNAGSGNFS
jgi:hypothetical protein